MSLPHIKNSKAGINREEPWFKNLFEVYFSIPRALQASTGAEDINTLTEQVKSVSGLGSLIKTPGVQKQTYMGATRSYIGAKVDDTSHEITVVLNLNMRNGTDNYIFKLFKGWNDLNYNLSTGERTLKVDHVADFLRVVMFNKAGDIFKDVTYHDVMLSSVEGLDSVDYDGDDLIELTVKFISDWADDIDALASLIII